MTQHLHESGGPKENGPVLPDGAANVKNDTDSTKSISTLTLTTAKSEARVDSRILARHLGNQHKAIVALVDRYASDFKGLGELPFQMEPLPSGQRERFALLNEDQTYFLLSLSRNSKRVVELKRKLVLAFKEARRAAELHAEYLPGYHDLRDQIHVLAAGSPNERFIHMNVARLIDKAAGVEPGERGRMDVRQKAMLIAAQCLATRAMQGAADHREGYARAKTALAPLMQHSLGGVQ